VGRDAVRHPGSHVRWQSVRVLWSSDGLLHEIPLERRQIQRNAVDRVLDGPNRRLLAELQADARLSNAELGRRVGLSAPAVAERVRRLEQAGVITGYRAEVDPAAIGYPLSAIVRIRPAAQQLRKVAELAERTPEVVECHRITGEDCFLIRMHLRDVEHLEEVIDQFILFGQTTTSIMQSSPVDGRPLPLQP
jgi:Lrp/AsnC family transcriptional regulator, leucine-responsive regulatory protein